MEKILPKIRIDNSKSTQYRLAREDFIDTLKKHRIWRLLAVQAIKLRYSRSMLGPLWVTLTMAITIVAMGVVYSELFHMNRTEYFPYLTAGMISWALISGLINELSTAFTSSTQLMQQMKFPYFLYINETAWRNMIVYAHNVAVWVFVIAIYHHSLANSFNIFLEIPALFLIFINANSIGMLLAIFSTRYRDIEQVIKNLLQILFFITPVMWKISSLSSPKIKLLVTANPLYAFIDLIRAPLLGSQPSQLSIDIVLGFTVISSVLCYFIFTRYRKTIIHWL